jgi:hypothetical protein
VTHTTTPNPNQWRPIEFAPKCGMRILLLAGDDIRIGSYNDASGDPDSMWELRYAKGSFRYVAYVPTHFQYLPQEPKQ